MYIQTDKQTDRHTETENHETYITLLDWHVQSARLQSSMLIINNVNSLDQREYFHPATSILLLTYLFQRKICTAQKTCPNFRIIFKMSVNEEWSTVTALVPHEPRLRSCTQGSLLALAPKENHTQNLHECLYRLLVSAPRSRQITRPAPHHSVFLQARCPSCRPTNSVKALKAIELLRVGIVSVSDLCP